MQERLYKVHIPANYEDDFDYSDGPWDAPEEPEGWREFARHHPHIPNDADFFLPKEDKIFRSRSSAKEHLAKFTRWGVDAYLVECTPRWESIPDANARRAKERTKP